MRINDSLYRYTAPLFLAGAIATAPSMVLGAENAPKPAVTPTPPAERNIGEDTDRIYERSQAGAPESTAAEDSDSPDPEVTPSPPAERNIGQGSDTDSQMDRSQARRPDRNAGDEEKEPAPSVTPTPPAERNIEQGD